VVQPAAKRTAMTTRQNRIGINHNAAPKKESWISDDRHRLRGHPSALKNRPQRTIFLPGMAKRLAALYDIHENLPGA
jgi:hypothetical protein